ncbi:MAG: hypothetical protein LUQ50_08115, partial [Methanospirillum sp.]|uniref:hypothetical protein n=1 Tax=Methanospirillum sp. TaxID=45200 RepID=UPI00236BB93F
SLEPYAGYMLASEEISAGGWSYDKWVPILAADPAQSPEQIGRSIISTFIEKEKPLGNTEALINLSSIGQVIDGLSDLGTALDSTELPEQSVLPIARAYEKATRFGENLGDSPSFGAIDLGTLAASLKTAVPDAAPAAEKLSSALNKTVVYVAHDELLGTTTGLSLADPLTVSEQTYQDEADVLAISPAWDTFTRNLRNEVNRTLPPSDMVSVGTDSYQIVEPTGSESVSVVYLAVSNETELLQLGTMPLEPQENGTYQLPDWDGKWYYLQDTSNPSHVALIDLYYGDSTTTGISKYISEVDLFRNGTPYDSVLYAYIDPDEDWTKFSLRPYSVMDNETVFSRTGFTPGSGDGMLTYASAYDLEGNELGLSQVGAMNLTGGVEIVNGMLPDGVYASALMIETPDGKQDVGDISMISIKDGVATPIAADREEGISSLLNGTVPSATHEPDIAESARNLTT